MIRRSLRPAERCRPAPSALIDPNNGIESRFWGSARARPRRVIWFLPARALHPRTKSGDDEMRIKPKTKRMEWKRWFAWHPVIIDNVTIWFETIERKRDPDIFDWVYSYRLIDKSDGRLRRMLRTLGLSRASGDRKLP